MKANEFGDAWAVGPAVLAGAGAPFYFGQIEAGGMVFRSEDGGGDDDFSAALFFAGWGPSLSLSRAIEWRTTALAGDLLMLFDEGGSGFSKRENELAVGLRSSLVLKLPWHLEAEAGVVGFRAFTSTPIDLLFAAGGIRYRFQTSSRLREWLQ